MSPALKANTYQWLNCGEEIFPALTAAINDAKKTIRLEVYTYANDEVGKQFLGLLVSAAQRGARVQVLLDAFGSITLPVNFWQPLAAAGGEARVFNPVLLKRLGFRDHRKILVCDEEIAFVGGFNIATEYLGDGVKLGWCDLGLSMTSPIAVQLAAAFDEMFAHAAAPQHRFRRANHSSIKRDATTDAGRLLLSGPSRGANPFTRFLRRDLKGARTVQIVCAYFLPNWRIRRDLMRAAHKGGRVQIILPGKSDVRVVQYASRSLYRRLLKAGVEIYEYQPQILHAKLTIIDGQVYAGSSNLDPRSLHLNYELVVRFADKKITNDAREIFTRILEHSKKIELAEWRKSRTWWRRLRQRWSYFLIVRIDPLVARWDFRRARG